MILTPSGSPEPQQSVLLWQGPPSRLPIDVGVVSEDDYARLTAKMVPSPVPADRSAFLMHPG